MTLPVCRYRGKENARGRFPCTSLWFLRRPQGVSVADCERCPYPDREPSERLLKALARRPLVVLSAPVPPGAPAPAHGVGTELAALLAALGLKADDCLPCHMNAAMLNHWGLAQCRDRRAEIVAMLAAAAKNTPWGRTLRAGWHLMRQPWFSIRDPFGSIVLEAIRRAEVAAG